MSGGIGGGEGGVPEDLLDTKGQVHGFSTTNAAVNVGTDLQTIYADSTETLGIGYGASARSTLGTTGDILSCSAANTLSAISPSTSGEVLTSNGATTLPSFQAAAGGGQWELIDNYNSDTTDTDNHTFTFASPYLNLLGTTPTYSELWIICNFHNWNYTIGEVKMQIASNGGSILTSGYGSSYGYKFDGTTMTQDVDTTATSWILADGDTNVASTGLRTETRLTMIGTGGGFYSNVGIQTNAMGDGGVTARKSERWEGAIGLGSSGHTLSSIKILSDANWDNDTNMSVYGVKWA